ncbi:MAG: restriction endonuclease subunit S [Phascolarctobacterium sp.]|nr:restriction endonuclease subunit S [Candidatus Phascolarctobacterium equi]
MMTPEQLKNSILQRAIEGKLVPCDLSKWKQVKLGEVCDVVNGFTPSRTNSEYWVNGNISWFTVDDIRDQGREIRKTRQHITENAIGKNTKRILPANTVLLCCTASVGEYAITKIPLTTNQQFNGLVIRETYVDKLYPFFLFYLASTFKKTLCNVAGRTTFNFVSVKKVGDISIPLPPLAEQKRIVAKLEELLPLVDEYAKAYEQLQSLNAKFPGDLKKSLLQYAMEGKLVPCDLSKWKQVKLGDITSNHGQKKPDKVFNYIDIGSIDNTRQKLSETENLIEPSKAPSRARKIVCCGDILYATVRPYLHNMCIVDRQFSNDVIASTGFAVMACDDVVSNKFLFYYLLSPTFDNYANAIDNSKGVAYPAINDKKLFSAEILLPPLEDQKRIVAKLEEILPLCDELK